MCDSCRKENAHSLLRGYSGGKGGLEGKEFFLGTAKHITAARWKRAAGSLKITILSSVRISKRLHKYGYLSLRKNTRLGSGLKLGATERLAVLQCKGKMP